MPTDNTLVDLPSPLQDHFHINSKGATQRARVQQQIMAKNVEAFLDGLRAELPEAGSDIEELANLYQRKLWHQLTLKIDQIIQQPGPLNTGDVPVRLFNQLVLDFASKMNLLKFAQFAVHASRSLGPPAAVIDFLQAAVAKLEEMKLPKAGEPILFLRMHIAQHRVEMVRPPVQTYL
jgi:26S proteasome regulatory subunit N9